MSLKSNKLLFKVAISGKAKLLLRENLHHTHPHELVMVLK
jgi:hypothetical protein